MSLQIEHVDDNGAATIKVPGEVDLYSSPDLRAAVHQSLGKAKSAVQVDLSGVPYMDSSGVATLVEGMRNAKQKKVNFIIKSPSESVMKVLRLSKLDTVFEIR